MKEREGRRWALLFHQVPLKLRVSLKHVHRNERSENQKAWGQVGDIMVSKVRLSSGRALIMGRNTFLKEQKIICRSLKKFSLKHRSEKLYQDSKDKGVDFKSQFPSSMCSDLLSLVF